MYKVMIIDDEPIIVEGLSRSVPWEKYQCQVVATANDGIEGRELIEKYMPQIVFVDICMPEMDGLTMIAGLKSQFEDMEVSVLTGFREFDYAQRAIKLGVTRFLLKPSNMDEIEEAISAMIDNLKKKNIHSAALRDSECSQGIIGAVGKKIEDNREEQEGEVANHENVASSFIVKNALQYIEENYQEKLLLSEVAEKTYVSQWHLSKLLNKHTGQNFSEILNSVRIDKAKEMLKDPSMRIGDIAEKVGFLDMAHFSRVFKKQIGVSANQYRNTVLVTQNPQ